MKSSIKPCYFLLFFTNLLYIVKISSAADTISANHIIRDGDTIVSSKQRFELGFFSPGRFTNRYLGIWYKTITPRTSIWVANRESPLRNSNPGVLTVNYSGQLVILDGSNNVTVWYSNSSKVVRNPLVQLLDSGNLVIREANDRNPENYVWQSFDYPTDTIVPGMDFGWNHATGTENYLSPWKAHEDPAPGNYTLYFDFTGYPQAFIKMGDIVRYRLGPWNTVRFSSRQDRMFKAGLYRNNNSVIYYREDASDDSVFSRYTLASVGVGQHFTWVNRTQQWVYSMTFPDGICDNYGLCGAHGSCNVERSPVCGCMDRFVPRDEQSWLRSDWSGGCVRRTPLNCHDDVFFMYSGIKVPDSRLAWFNGSLGLEECKAVCLRNCSCTAYTNMNGCLIWFAELFDFRSIPGERQEIYIRMAASELGSNGMKRKILISILTSLAAIILIGMSIVLILSKSYTGGLEESNDEDLELPIYDLSTVTKATNSFADSNKLGEGGYGRVYKGILEDGKEIAVKRLSEFSSQGADEFKNEVLCIAKLQHRNLVKLLGCCTQGDEKMLIYEYMINLSLDLILFDKTKSKQLDWSKRNHIINGIARGLLYLHQDSHSRIIHRNLKANNVLLDSDLNPKISDFGMARIFGGNETEAQTKRVVGTYGYMSPEYAGEGLFSLKSDVYSFGVLVLEIITGQRNRGFLHQDHHQNLIGHAWIMYKEGKSLELVDPNIVNTISINELLRSIHVALLCVQQCPDERPSMSTVVLMLGSAGVLPDAGQPGFFTERRGSDSDGTRPSNENTVTQLEAR